MLVYPERWLALSTLMQLVANATSRGTGSSTQALISERALFPQD